MMRPDYINLCLPFLTGNLGPGACAVGFIYADSRGRVQRAWSSSRFQAASAEEPDFFNEARRRRAIIAGYASPGWGQSDSTLQEVLKA